MSLPIRVTHVLLSLDVGGLERVVMALARQGLSRGQQVSVVCLVRPGTLAGQVEALGVQIICLNKPDGLHFPIVKQLRRAFRALRPDVIHTHQIGALFYAGPAARWLGMPVVHTEHGKNFVNRRRRWLGWLAGIWARRFFCVSQDIADDVSHYRVMADCKVRVVPNGIDPQSITEPSGQRRAIRQALGIPLDSPVIGTVGRLDAIKRHDVLLDAFAEVQLRFPKARLVLVGDGPLRESLQAQATSRGLGDSVHFTGFQTCPGAYLQAMDVFALTSRSEGLPLSILEAWAAELPVVASRVGGLLELVQDSVTGLLCPFEDVMVTAATLERLIGDASLRQRLGKAGRELLTQCYTLETMSKAYENEYLRVCKPALRRVMQVVTS